MDRPHWGKQIIEEALEPDLPIVDAHHHIWPTSPLDGYEAYDYKDLFDDMEQSGHNILATVYVDSHANYSSSGPERFRVVGETEHADWIAEQAKLRGPKTSGACAAIVSNADLLEGASVGAILDAHQEASPRFRGIRHMTAIDADLPPAYGGKEVGVMTRPLFREGFVEVGKRGLTLDTWLFHPQLAEVIELARAFPDYRIVVDHIGGPLGVGRYTDCRDDAFVEWKSGMRALAKSANVFIKLGGLNIDTTGLVPIDREKPFNSREMAARQSDHILTAIDLFGTDRCMFESNFPVDMKFTSFVVLWNSFKLVTAAFTNTERTQLFSGTAIEAYQISDLALVE